MSFFDLTLTPDKVCLDVLEFGRQHGADDLLDLCLDLITMSKTFFGDPEVLALITKESIEFICAFTTKLPVSEQIFCEWLLIWKQAHNNDANFDLLARSCHIRFDLLTYDLLAKILNAGLLSDPEIMRIYKIKAKAEPVNDDAGDGSSSVGSSFAATPPKSVTPCARVCLQGVEVEVGFEPNEYPPVFVKRFKRHVTPEQRSTDLQLSLVINNSHQIAPLQSQLTLEANGIVDGCFLIASLPTPAESPTIAALPEAAPIVESERQRHPSTINLGSDSESAQSGNQAIKVDPSDPLSAADPEAVRAGGTDGASTPEVERVVTNYVSSVKREAVETIPMTQPAPKNLHSSPIHGVTTTASDCSTEAGGAESNVEADAENSTAPAAAQPLSVQLSQQTSQYCPNPSSTTRPLLSSVVRPKFSPSSAMQSAKERVFWWKCAPGFGRAPNKSAAESCIPAIKSSPTLVPLKPLPCPSYNPHQKLTLRNPPFARDASSSISSSIAFTSPINIPIPATPTTPNSSTGDTLDDSGLSMDHSRTSDVDVKFDNDDSSSISAAATPQPEKAAKRRKSKAGSKRASVSGNNLSVSSSVGIIPPALSSEANQGGPPTTSTPRVSTSKSTAKAPKRARRQKSQDSVTEEGSSGPPLITPPLRPKGPPAPQQCFKQAPHSLINNFEVGMKVEVPDPKAVVNTVCIATVVDRIGPRLRLRLDGTDDRNDIWRLVDDRTVQPVGSCERRGHHLQPPISFRKNIAHWRRFLFDTLKDAHVAPDTAFQPEPESPTTSFCLGHRLEAVDRKNEALICPATIAEVTPTEVLVHFEGWNPESYDYWCEPSSRDLFPMGWCARNNHPLQPVGQEAD